MYSDDIYNDLELQRKIKTKTLVNACVLTLFETIFETAMRKIVNGFYLFKGT